MKLEKVYTVNRFFDDPILGIADFDGVPHIYESLHNDIEEGAHDFRDIKDYVDCYHIMKAEPDLMALVLEDWNIQIEWKCQYDKGLVCAKDHPRTDDQKRHNKPGNVIANRLKTIPEKSKLVRAEFLKDQNNWWVKWEIIA